MQFIFTYLLGLLGFTLIVWALEAIFIVFAAIFRNRAFINFVTISILIISYIYQVLLAIGAFIWLLQITNLIIAILVSIFLGSLFYGIFAGIFGFIIRLPAMLLMAWAEDKIPE